MASNQGRKVFDPEAWLRDTSWLSAASRGIWISLISHMMYKQSNGVLQGTLDELAAKGCCSPGQMLDALKEFKNKNVCNITFERGSDLQWRYTVVNRRLNRSGSGYTPKIPKDREGKYLYTTEFEQWWKHYPQNGRKNKPQAFQAWLGACRKVASPGDLMRPDFATSGEGQGEYTRLAATWLNQEAWTESITTWNRSPDKKKHEGLF